MSQSNEQQRQRPIVVPGEPVGESRFYHPGMNILKISDRMFSTTVGIVRVEGKRLDVISLKSFYQPKVGDLVIGIVKEPNIAGWTVDINSPFLAFLPLSEYSEKRIRLTKDSIGRILETETVITGVIKDVSIFSSPVITMKGKGLGVVSNGTLLNITASKVPRLIGKKGSMLSVIERATGVKLTVGQNGRIIVHTEDSNIVAKIREVIGMVERESHMYGLTERVEALLVGRKM
ncbi:MAG: exosome complex RNA-binding protein Rrp4 [Crenarchaeota archaeon]|nr:exosome complex RNA-binding protein Rrp4 [Thermoproteota archaeon]MDW8033365.1 exosome complex RNA-binding protein Rrp4 [Nitrososphaerota archaeon]